MGDPGRMAAASLLAAPPPVALSDTRLDFLLLASAMFLGRFTLTFGHSLLNLAVAPLVLLLFYQYLSGRLFVQYDRVLWFLAMLLCAGWSLLSNFDNRMLPSFFLFVVSYSLLTLVRPTPDWQYREVLQSYQLLVAILSCIAIAQFLGQFLIDGKSLVNFYGIMPQYLFTDRQNPIIPVMPGSSLIKSNALFLAEPSTLSQVTALAILIEVLAFRRLKCLVLFAVALLLSYSGTGLLVLCGFVPLAACRYRNARVPVLIVAAVALLLAATGAIDFAAFTARAGEFHNIRASGFERFVSPFWLAKQFLATAAPSALLFGSGPGTADAYAGAHWYGGFAGTWFKVIYEYGLIGTFVFVCFFTSCFRQSKCPGLLIGAIVFGYLFFGDEFLDAGAVTTVIVLCTLSSGAAADDQATRNWSRPDAIVAWHGGFWR